MSFHDREHQDSEAREPASPEGRERNEMTQGSGFSSRSFIRSRGFLRKRRGDARSAYIR